MTIQPTLTTERLVLRPFNIGDCQQVALLEFARMHFELNGITVMHLVDNLRSKSVIQKLKIPYVGDKTLRMQGKERKVCVYQLTFVASE
ncbi:hypothetical protein P3647_08420 [Vibrio parahaemolyticus]|uniref:hypothetical protein n=1 Tax=Vibrio parahaemolyticus TaxID=670 RepID=UPI00100F6318|nr:hypothetical protein [Vibrio parahaemolyticus]EGQ8520191.1 hypothetical protein [Vibrio parahaemolyticus]EHR1003817.1 hypothetical protein [Vibrio parahaemolyticus]EIU6862564.1 hypothetical protein [Vibrio parahaemolyticus]EIU7063840.1 hypothetical protein [Vibrio parahaemolyticus]ELB2128404.1 hypothetical protein [Vibrio parahaemolyticus]